MKIAIDGPAGAGKSTVAKTLSQLMSYIYIDTGAMYRSLTWKALQTGTNLNDEKALYELAENTNIYFQKDDSPQQKVFCDSFDVSEEIRSPRVSSFVSKLASYPSIRELMVKRQREMARNHSVVMDGRDIGECVLPDANYKLFLTASIEERARRRLKEMNSQGYEEQLESIKNEIAKRDEDDARRDMGALKVLPDSIVIDTSNMTIEQVVERILSVIRED
ncbi:MAG: (d)CMP kinase [Syntrophomonas sp.]|uniref:(d)CMP kinase n=1 Tax=Syntrophomonas sp. TaxID=2053627 RepID=UPI002603A97F|nr:(d)CMP kinase [Syntrophomonas sp.]MDD4626939.1 (d)CMP kinase [Syntrophomonas sp.]